MKNLKYIVALMLMLTMGFSYTSCDKDVDPAGPSLTSYTTDVVLSDPGSLSAAAQTHFTGLVDSTLWWNSTGLKVVHSSLRCTESYALQNFNAMIGVEDSENDIIQKIIVPMIDEYGVRDFAVTCKLTQDSTQNVIASKVYYAKDY